MEMYAAWFSKRLYFSYPYFRSQHMGYHLELANTQRNRDNSASFGSKGGISSTGCINVTCQRENT